MNRETVETILKKYFGDKETAQKFAAAMREGLNRDKIARLELERDQLIWDSKRGKIAPYLIQQVENEIKTLKEG